MERLLKEIPSKRTGPRNRRISKDSDGVEKLDKSAKIAFEDFDLCVTALYLGFWQV